MAAPEPEDRADAARRAIERGRAESGDALGRDPAVARRVLEEQLPQDPAAVTVLVAAVRAGVPERLAADLPGQPAGPVLARLAESLTTHESVAPERAAWAVAVWAVGLGLAQAAPAAAGAAEAPTPAPAAPAAPPPAPKPPARAGGARRRRLRLPLLIAGGVVAALVLAGGGVLLLRPTSSPGTVAKPAATVPGASTTPTAASTPTPAATALPQIVVAAHRGGNEVYPLETAEAMLNAAALPGVAVETDMRFTSDGVPVLVHDPTVDATMPCSGPTPRPQVAAKTYAWLVANCRTLASASPSGGRYTIPKVEDVASKLAAVPQAQWLLEIKTVLTPKQVTGLFDLLERHDMVDRTVITSFFASELAKARAESARRGDDVRLLQFVGDTSLGAAAASGNGLWAVGISNKVLTKAYVSALHGAGVKAVDFTVNTSADWQRARAAGVDFVITDKPVAWLTWKSSGAQAAATRPPAARPRPVVTPTWTPSPTPTWLASTAPTPAVTPIESPAPTGAVG